MSAIEQIVADLARVDDSLYLKRDADIAMSTPRAAASYRFKGLALGAPRAIPVESYPLLPGLLVTGESAARAAEFPLRDNAIAVAVDLGLGTIKVNGVFRPDPSKSPERKPDTVSPASSSKASAAVNPALGAGDRAGAVWLDFKELLDLPWQESELALRVIAFDQVSNPALVHLSTEEVTHTAQSFSRGEARDIVAKNRAAAAAAHGLPRFVRSDDTPALQSEGVALSLGVNETQAGAPLPLHGALRLKLSAASIVFSLLSRDWVLLPAAVVKATLLVTIRNSNWPARIDLDIPIWSDQKLQPGDVVDAAFSLDLTKALPMRLPPGGYCIYLLAGPYLSGPHRLLLKPNPL